MWLEHPWHDFYGTGVPGFSAPIGAKATDVDTGTIYVMRSGGWEELAGGSSGGVSQQDVDDSIAAHALSVDPHTAYALEANLAAIAASGNASDLTGTLAIARIPTGSSSSTVCIGNDGRLSDARTPVAHTHAASDTNSGTLAIARLPTGSTSSTVCIGDDSRLSDARTPTAHSQAASTISDSTIAGRALLTAADAAAQRTAMGCGGLAGSGTGWTSVIAKDADQNFNSATPANVSGLSFAVTSAVRYFFRFVLVVRSNTATVGVAVDLTHGGATVFAAQVQTNIAADGVGAEWQGTINANADAVVPTSVPSINADYLLTVEGVIVPSATGTLQLRARTETGTTVVTVRQGSCGMLMQLP